jgi:predicted peptidase
MQTSNIFKTTISKKVSLPYLLYKPTKPKTKLPLVMFLHGAGERGNDLDLVKIHGIPKLIEQGQAFPFIAVSPQCPKDSWWPLELESLKGLLDEIISKHDVDKKRVYLTGLSMGGYGTWYLAGLYPQTFAAIAPICGGGDFVLGEQLATMPIWAFHGDKDNVVPLSESQRMVDIVKKAGGKAKLTVYKNVDHDSWTKTYNNPKFYEWLLSHKNRLNVKQGQSLSQ